MKQIQIREATHQIIKIIACLFCLDQILYAKSHDT